MPAYLDAREFQFLRGRTSVDCSDLLILTILAATCICIGLVAYAMRVREEWQQVARDKRAGDAVAENDLVLELEAGRRYNIPVEHLRGMEIRVR